MDKAIPFPTEQERRNFFWTKKTPRPTAETYPYRVPALSEVQAIWDAADERVREHEERIEELRAEREAASTKAKAERDAEFAAREAEKAKQRESVLRGQYLSVPGNTEEGWERDRARVLSDDAVTRMRTAQSGALISPAAMLR